MLKKLALLVLLAMPVLEGCEQSECPEVPSALFYSELDNLPRILQAWADGNQLPVTYQERADECIVIALIDLQPQALAELLASGPATRQARFVSWWSEALGKYGQRTGERMAGAAGSVIALMLERAVARKDQVNLTRIPILLGQMFPALKRTGEPGWRAFHLKFRLVAPDGAPEKPRHGEQLTSWRKTNIGGLFQNGSQPLAQKAGMTPDGWRTQISLSLMAGVREAGFDMDEP
jgi:hypothetical protein